MGIEDYANQAKDALNSEQGQEFANQGLDRAADAADNATGGEHSDHIQQGRDAAGDFLGGGDSGQPEEGSEGDGGFGEQR